MNFFEDDKIIVISQAQYDPNAWYVFFYFQKNAHHTLNQAE